jgi:hypothetical protein
VRRASLDCRVLAKRCVGSFVRVHANRRVFARDGDGWVGVGDGLVLVLMLVS